MVQSCLPCVTGQFSAGFFFVICDSLQALPHPTSIRASVVGFDLSPALMLCLFDDSSEGVAGFPLFFVLFLYFTFI